MRLEGFLPSAFKPVFSAAIHTGKQILRVPHHMMFVPKALQVLDCSNFVRGLPLSYFNLIIKETIIPSHNLLPNSICLTLWMGWWQSIRSFLSNA